VHSATQILAFQEWKLEFIKMFNDKPLLISAARSLLSYCTVVVCEQPLIYLSRANKGPRMLLQKLFQLPTHCESFEV
jgi:hypothetical protein